MLLDIIVYPFTMMFNSTPGRLFEKHVMLSLMTLLHLQKAYCQYDDPKLADPRVSSVNDKDTEYILPFHQELMRDMIVSLAQLLHLMKSFKVIRLFAFGSYPCENFFS